jgi:hypothetical protein
LAGIGSATRRFSARLEELTANFTPSISPLGRSLDLPSAGVNIVTLAEGDITHLHIGFTGTMNSQFLKDLAEKTHRGLRGG